MKRKGGMQPHAKGSLARKPGPALDAMLRGKPAGRPHPSQAIRELQKRNRKSALGRAFAKRGM